MFNKFPLDCFENSKEKLADLLTETRSNIEKLIGMSNKTYEILVIPYQVETDKVNSFFTPIAHTNSVCNSDRSRKAFEECLPLLTEFFTSLSQDKRIYGAFNEIYKNEYDSLTSSRRKLLNDALRDFRLEGVDLGESQKKEIKRINLRLSELSNAFSQNVLNDTDKYELIIEDHEDVREMPDKDLEASKVIGDKIKYRFTLQSPSYLAYMKYGNNRNLREKLYRAYNTRAPENGKIITEILNLRRDKARLLGFENYAELSLSRKSAESVSQILSFLRNIAKRCKGYAEKECQELKKLAALDGIEYFESYDLMYYSEKVKNRLFAFDENFYRAYFSCNSVVKGSFSILNILFGITYSCIDGPVWHEDVNIYELRKNNILIGMLYMDLHARKGKRDGAWMHEWITHHRNIRGEIVYPAAFIVANFPGVEKEIPSLLRHNDVVTLFHEMGHAIHHLCSKVDEIFISGINGVEWDVVEFPSQFLENFAYSEEVLANFAYHYKDNKSLPSDKLQLLEKIKNFNIGLNLLRQIEFSIFDILLHQGQYNEEEVQKLLGDVRHEVAIIKPPAYVRFQNAFSHIFAGGYAAGYYSYKWAERMSADAFILFKEKGLLEPDMGEKFYNSILVKGGSSTMLDLFREFAGRDADERALLKLNGLN